MSDQLKAWEQENLGKHLAVDGVKADANQCSQVPLSWLHALFPNVPVLDLLPQVGSKNGVKDWAGKSTKYVKWIPNDFSDINQLPLPGDIGVSGATPAKGYMNTFPNPYGHTWVFKSASASGFTAIQQNAPQFGEGVNEASYPWLMQPVLGWFRPVQHVLTHNTAPAAAAPPVPTKPATSPNVGKTVTFPESDTYVPVFHVEGPYDFAHKIGGLDPKLFKRALSYVIKQDLGNGLYVIDSNDWGPVAVALEGSHATIS